MMRLLITLLLISFLTTTKGQLELTTEQWREDLHFLQQKIHQDYAPLFKKVSVSEFDDAVAELHKDIPQLENHEVVVRLAELISLFGYGHTSLPLTNWSGRNKNGFSQLPLKLYLFSDGLYIQGIHKKYSDYLGAKVLKIGDLSAEEALKAIRPAVPAENDSYFKAYGVYYLTVPEILHAKGVIEQLDQPTFLLERNGQKERVQFEPMETEGFPGKYTFIQQKGDWLDVRDQTVTPLWLKKLDKIYFYEYLPEHRTVYVRHSQIQDDRDQAIPEFYAEVFDFIENNEVDKMILDLRLNGGGNNYKNKPIVTGLIETEKINQPGKLFVVIGRFTFSACQNLVNELENYTEGTFVGEPTAENVNFFGDTRMESLPHSQLPVYLSFAWWQDKAPWDNRHWTTPELAADLSFEDYVNNHDPVMDLIEEYTYQPPIIERMEVMYREGKVEELKAMVSDYLNDPKHRYNDIETRVNDFGYQLISQQKFKEAVSVLSLNTEFFPDSPNAWDSLAEAHWRLGDEEKAIKLYKKAIAMDPDGDIGANARSMLKKIRE